ncbi:MAG: LPS export ABC transporter periplasmic protein LptC [Pseudomonadota bacterium]
MNNRFIVLAGFVLLVALAINWVIDLGQTPPVVPSDSQNDPDLYMVNARITQFSPEGFRQHQINAARMTHFPLTDVTTMHVPNVFLFSRDTDTPWEIIALNGRLLPQSQLRQEVVELWDQVVAVRDRPNGDFVNIQTDNMKIYPHRDYAETNALVIIDNTSGRTTAGGGMKAWFDEGRFEFSRSRTDRVLTIVAPGASRRASQGD